MFKNPIDFLDKEFNERHYILKTLKTPNSGRLLARSLLVTGVLFLILLFLPWQQNIRGTGLVTARAPENRPQTIQSAIAGRVSEWHVREGDFVNKGDTILTLAEIKEKFFDPDLLLRLEEQIIAKENAIEANKRKIRAVEQQVAALRDGFTIKQKQARNKLQQTQYKLRSDSVDFIAEKVRYQNAQSQFERNKQLYEAGNITLTKYQDVESKFQEGRMKIISAENKYLESQTEVINARVEISAVEADYLDKISKAESDLNTSMGDLADKESDLAKLRNEYANMEIRNQQYQLIAPQSGYLVEAVVVGIGETIKEGEAVATIMPASPDIAVAMYVKAMDVPLIEKQRHVRIQFDGWPALQFSGWPAVSVGTFGGTVQVIDYVNSKEGKFRIVVTPDPNDEPWPKQLRMGSGTKGWVMLETVPVWYEIWRQLNGFPPSLYEAPSADESLKDESEK